MFARHPPFLAVEVALPENVRDAHHKHRRESRRNLVDEDVVENRQFAGLRGCSSRAAQEHHRSGARRDEDGSDRLFVHAERSKRRPHERETEHAETDGRGNHHRDGLAEQEGEKDERIRTLDERKRLDRDVDERVIGADMRHVARKPDHRHDEKTEVREVVREHVADELNDVEHIVARRERLFRHEAPGVENDGKEQHRCAARKENEGRVFALDDCPSDQDEHDASENDAGHGVSPKRPDALVVGRPCS